MEELEEFNTKEKHDQITSEMIKLMKEEALENKKYHLIS